MDIITKDDLFETYLREGVVKMIKDDPRFEGEGYGIDDIIKVLELDGESLEGYIEMNPKQFGQAMASVVFGFLGSDSLAELVAGE
jgi:hypothetical protein